MFFKLFLGAVKFGSQSKTAKNPGYSEETREILAKGPLRYEMDLYNLCKAIFYKRLDFYKINIGDEPVYNKTKHTRVFDLFLSEWEHYII